MKKIKIVSSFICIATVVALLAACGGTSGSTPQTTGAAPEPTEVESTAEPVTEIVTEEADETQEEEETEEPVVIDTSWYTEDNTAICTGVYFTGKDIAAGNYILTCVNASWAIEVDIFESEDKYWSYHKSGRFTVGEESAALEANALSVNNVYPEKSCAVNLQDGYVLRIKGGTGTLVRADGSDEPAESVSGKTIRVMDGLYNAGDIKKGSYMLTCTDTSYSMQVVAFENKAGYDAYLAADHATVGDESSALEQNAMIDFYLKAGESMYINIRDDMILAFSKGEGQLEPVSMSWAK